MGTKSRVAVASLIVGIACFLNLLGIEKAIAAIILGAMGLKEISAEEKAGKWFAYAGIILGSVYIITIAILLIIYGPQFIERIKMLAGK
jgi:hypothetical protein